MVAISILAIDCFGSLSFHFWKFIADIVFVVIPFFETRFEYFHDCFQFFCLLALLVKFIDLLLNKFLHNPVQYIPLNWSVHHLFFLIYTGVYHAHWYARINLKYVLILQMRELSSIIPDINCNCPLFIWLKIDQMFLVIAMHWLHKLKD